MAAFDLLAPTIVSPYHPDDPEGLFVPYSRFQWSGGVLTAEFDQRQYGNDLLYVYFLVPVDPETGDFLEWTPTVLDATVRATEPSGVVQDIKVTAALSTGGGYSLGATIGQPDAGAASGGAYSLRGGFWAGVPANYNAFVPIAMR